MFNEIKIAQSEHQIRNAKYNRMHEVEGMTVVVPNIFDRALQAVRTALTSRSTAAQKSHATLTRGGVAAK
jgi:hypothetical protein